MYKRILVPLDGSELAEQVLPIVRILGKGLQAGVELLRVFEPVSPSLADPDHGLYLDRIITSVRVQMQDYLESVAVSLRKDGLTVSTIVHEGNPAVSIVQEAETVPDTLVAICTHGRSGVTRWVLGSTTDKVLHATTHPLLIVRVRDRQAFGPEVKLSSVLVPLDGSTVAEQALPYTVALAMVLGLKVILVRVVQSLREYALRFTEFGGYPFAEVQDVVKRADAQAREYLDRVGERLREQGMASVQGHVLHGHPAATIIDTAREIENCLIAMTSHGDSGIDRWFRGSVADRVVRHSGEPVLVIRAVKEHSREA